MTNNLVMLSLLPLAGTMLIAMFPTLIIYHYLKILFSKQVRKNPKIRWFILAGGVFIWAALHDVFTTFEYMTITNMNWSNNVFYIFVPIIIVFVIITGIAYAVFSQRWVRQRIEKSKNIKPVLTNYNSLYLN